MGKRPSSKKTISKFCGHQKKHTTKGIVTWPPNPYSVFPRIGTDEIKTSLGYLFMSILTGEQKIHNFALNETMMVRKVRPVLPRSFVAF